MKLTNLRNAITDHENEKKLTDERLEQLKILTQNLTYLNELNQQLECQYLRFTEDIQMNNPGQTVSTQFFKDENDTEQQQQQMKSSASITTNGQEEQSELDSVSFCEEHRDELDDLQQIDEGQTENYELLLADLIETLIEQSNTQTYRHSLSSSIRIFQIQIRIKLDQILKAKPMIFF